jgi:hypothetical protein
MIQLDANKAREEIYIKTVKQAISQFALSNQFLILKKACSCLIVSLKARARNVKRKINTATHVKSAVQLTMQLSY